MDRRVQRVVSRTLSEFPGIGVRILPFHDGEEPGIEHFLFFINAPREGLCAIEDYAWQMAEEEYGEDPPPFLIGALGYENTEKYFP